MIYLKILNFLNLISKVANVESGKGRDDLNIEILINAEGVLRKISGNKSKSVRHLADNIKKSFTKLRELLRKYEKNLDAIDPQLKNNSDLVECLISYESSWEKGKHYLLNTEKYGHLLFFSQFIEVLCEKYEDIQEQLESRDPSIFIWLPNILIIKSLENEDKGICKEFNPPMFNENEESGKVYNKLKKFRKILYDKVKDKYKAYNLLEKLAIYEDNYSEIEIYVTKEELKDFQKNLRLISMQMQRYNPTDWNYFFDLSINYI